MIIKAKAPYRILYSALCLYAVSAILLCSISVYLKIMMVIVVVAFSFFEWRKQKNYQAQYLPLSHHWLLHDTQTRKIVRLQGCSFISQWLMILNWRSLDGKTISSILFCWQYDKNIWRYLKVLVLQQKMDV